MFIRAIALCSSGSANRLDHDKLLLLAKLSGVTYSPVRHRSDRRGVAMLKTLAFVAALAISPVAYSQMFTQVGIAPVSVTGVRIGSHINSDLSVPVPKTVFKPTDAIFVSVATRATQPTRGSLGALWTYGAGEYLQSVHDESKEVVFNGEGTTVFKISKPDDWPDGEYHVEIFLDGQSVSKVGFAVR